MKKKIDIYYKSNRFLNDILLGGEYSFLFRDWVVIDIGANIGAFSFYIYNRAKIIYAIEPVQENIECLRKTVVKNRLNNIRIFEIAICGDKPFTKLKKYGIASEGAWRLEKDGTIEVKTKTLAKFMDDEKIDYVDIVKIDVEGNEQEIFESKDFPRASKKINTIIGELHPKVNIRKILEELNFKYKEYKNRHFIARKI